MQDLREGDIWQKHITLFQNIINPLADASINPIPVGGGEGGFHPPPPVLFLRGFKYVALIIKNSFDFSKIYFADTLPSLPTNFSRLYSAGAVLVSR